MDKYKSRFVSCVFSHREVIDSEETFAPVARYTTIRSIISLASVLGWTLHQMDVKFVFLNGEVEEEVYIAHLEGFMIHGKDSYV